MTRCERRLRQLISEQGPVPFALFMEEALYGPSGYYRRPEAPIGPRGDYVTSASESDLFGRTTAGLLLRLDRLLEEVADYLEVGYGDGRHLGAVMEASRAPVERRVWGCERGVVPPPPGVLRIEAPGECGTDAVTGLVFSYELFDALPVHRLVRREGELRELFVALGPDGKFLWREGLPSDVRLRQWNLSALHEGQVLDVTPEWAELYGALAAGLERGLVVTCDYGFRVERLLDPRTRRNGTLACYRRHRVHRDPFVAIGRQDLTAHVDFSALIAAGEEQGLETVGLFRQAEWLVANGLLEDAESWNVEERLAVQELVNLEGVGEETRVLVQGRGVDAARLLPELCRA